MKEKPKSQLFSKLDLSRDEDFASDIEVIGSLEKNVLDGLPERAVLAWLAPSERETGNICDVASRELGVPRAQLDHAMRFAQFLVRAFLKNGEAREDQPRDIVSDLEHIYALSAKNRASVSKFIEHLKELTHQKAEPEAQRRRYAQRSMPVLESISTTANYRIVYDEDFKVDTEISSFKPKCLGVIPMGVIQLIE